MPFSVNPSNYRLANAVLAFLAVYVAILFFATAASAQDANNRPARATEAVNALLLSDWQELEDGVSVIEASTALGTRIRAFKLQAGKFAYSVEQQVDPMGERANSVMKRTNAFMVVNGGFFGLRSDSSLYPVGKLLDDGNTLSAPWINQGGYFAIGKSGEPDVFSSHAPFPDDVVEAIQTRPVLIEPGRHWAMRTNGNEPARRTMFCKLPDGDNVLMLVSGGGLTLFEAGWIFRAAAWGGFFNCDSAIAFDGGGSTQLSVRGYPDFMITGLTPVQNFVVISRK